MTPKEKAEELYTRYESLSKAPFKRHENLKESALIAVDEVMLEQCKSSEKKDARYQDERIMFWIEVKQEIINL